MSSASPSSSLIPINTTDDTKPRAQLDATAPGVVTTVAMQTTHHQHSSSSSPRSFDFITSSNAVKDLFMLPYALDRPVSVAIHNVEGTLILEDANEPPTKTNSDHAPMNHRENTNHDGNYSSHESLPKNETKEEDGDHDALIRKSATSMLLDDPHKRHIGGLATSTNNNEEALTIVNNVLLQQQKHLPPATKDEETSYKEDIKEYLSPSEPREYRSWQFQDMNLLVGDSNALVYGSSATIRLEDASRLQALSQQHERDKTSGAFLSDYQLANRKASYAEVATARSTVKEKSCSSRRSSDLVDQVQLQSCSILPAMALGSDLIRTNEMPTATPVTPVTTVLDTYLDNIMANVPQLALCLQEKGFVRSIKLMNTEEIPSRMLHSRTVDTSIPFEAIRADPQYDPSEQIFTPEIMEMNAHALLRFLKTNCAKDNSTYLLRREAGCTNVQLFDISSAQPQWIWRLAMMSYRFANRLRNLGEDNAQRRSFRARQRSLLQNTLDLLEMLGDMNGNRHESLVASVNENLADTFLVGGIDEEEPHTTEVQPSQAEIPIAPPPLALSVGQPYANVSIDSLGKAQTRLTYGIKVLRGLLDTKSKQKLGSRHKRQASDIVESVGDSSDDEDNSDDNSALDEISPAAIQLVGIQKKTIDVTLCMAMEDLKLYWTSSAMHNLRKASNLIVETLDLIKLTKEDTSWLKMTRQQYGWMWEMCGHFARSFASDEKWRDQGHSSGDDVVGILQETESLFEGRRDLIGVTPNTNSSWKRIELTMQELSGVVAFECPRLRILNDEGSQELRRNAISLAKDRLEKQTTIQRERRRVLVGSCLAYDRALSVLDKGQDVEIGKHEPIYTLQQRLGDACNETGKALLNELRVLIASSGKANVETSFVAETICSSAEYWLLRGLQSFSLCKDIRNLALLHCNLCQCYKLRANSIFAHIVIDQKRPASTHAEECLENAANHLQEAHSALEVRHSDSTTWDMVSIELAATYLVLGVRRRQRLVGTSNSIAVLSLPPSKTISPGEEKGIVEPIQKAMNIYKGLGNISQVAAANYQLALFYSKIWTRQRDESKTREKLAAAFSSFHTALKLFSEVMEGNEVNFCLVALDLAGFYASLADEGALNKALRICTEISDALSFDLIVRINANLAHRDSALEQLKAICMSADEQTFALLKRLVKIDSGNTAYYKALYRAGLTAKTGRDQREDLGLGHEEAEETAKILLTLRAVLGAIDDAGTKEAMPRENC